MRKLFLSLIICIFLISSITALEFDNVKSYDEVNKEVTIKNCNLWLGICLINGETIAKAKLLSPLDKQVALGYQEVARFNVNSYQDYTAGIKEIELFNIKDNMKKFNRDIDIKVLSYEDISVDDYGESCSNQILNGTSQEVCTRVVTGSHIEQREKWTKLTPADFKKNDNLVIAIFTNVEKGDKVEWIPNLFGARVEEWAVWTQSMNIGLKGYWKIDEGTGTNLIDSVNGYNMTSVGSPVWTSGKIANALNFTGNGKWVQVNTSTTDLQGGASGTMSIIAWVYPTAYSNYPTIFYRGDGASTHNFVYALASNSGKPSLFTPGEGWSTATTALNLNAWNFVAVSCNAGTCTYYLNANSDGSTSGESWTLGQNYINRISFYGANAGWEGTIDEVGFWNRSLSAQEITDLYNGGVGITYDGMTPTMSVLNSYPADNYNFTASSINFGCNVSSANQNITSVVLNVTGTANWTQTVSGLATTGYNATFTNNTLIDGTYNWNCYAIGTSTNGSSTLRNFIKDTTAPVISLVYPTGDYYSENQSINYSYTDTNKGTCWYSLNGGSNITLANCVNSTLNLATGNNTVTLYANDSFGNVATSSTKKSYLYPTLALCNATINKPFMNITFKDEISLATINASLSSLSISYYLNNDTTLSRTLTYSNTSVNNPSYSFCAYPNSSIIASNMSLVAYSAGYPTRYFSSNDIISNITTNKSFNLLSSADGVYQPITVIRNNGATIEGATVTSTLNGEIVDSRTTDSSGTVQLWLDPNFAHNLVTTKSDIGTDSRTINPSTSTIYVTLGDAQIIPENITITYTEGVNWNILPNNSYLINNTVYPMNFTVSAGVYTINSFGFTIYDQAMNIIGSDSAVTNGGTVSEAGINTNGYSVITIVGYWVSNGTTNTVSKTYKVFNSTETDYSLAFLGKRFGDYVDSGFFGLKRGTNLNLFCFIIIIISTGIFTYKFGIDNPIIICLFATGVTALLEFGLGLINVGYVPLTLWAGLGTFIFFLKEVIR